VLAVTWLMLTELSAAHATLAVVLAVVVPLTTAPFLEPLSRVGAPVAAARLSLRVVWDIVLANIAVARLVLGPLGRMRPRFVTVPLAVTHPHSISLLASIITMTPGTVSVDVGSDRRTLLVHVLDCPDPAQAVSEMKDRYEKPILEIFGC
jgi:multicomponent K+:H+ antiporter subunit E